ncbi:MAG: RNA polymerase sigma factor [Actinobacteria bacterium]|nr:RNA polymerase sigma factor [Actinomycetota bacterium]
MASSLAFVFADGSDQWRVGVPCGGPEALLMRGWAGLGDRIRIEDGIVDRGVIAGAKDGDEAAWRELYGSIAPSVRGYFRARRVDDPEDLVGTVFLELARGIDGFVGDEHQFRAWAFTIAHRRWVDEVRAAQRRSTVALDEASDIDSGFEVEQDVMAVFERESLLRHIDGLSSAQRSVVLLKVLGDFSHVEIADVLGKTVTAVRVNYHRALKALRMSMEPIDAPHSSHSITVAEHQDVTL